MLDEAHHLPTIARDHGAASASVKGSRRWLEKLAQGAGKLARTLNKESLLDPQLKLQDALASLQPDLKALEQWLAANDRLFNEEKHCRFADGVLPDPLPMLAENLKEASKKALRALDRMQGAIGEALKDGEIRRKEAEPLLAESGFYLQRLEVFMPCGRCWGGTWHKARRRWLAGWSRAMTATSGCMPPPSRSAICWKSGSGPGVLAPCWCRQP